MELAQADMRGSEFDEPVHLAPMLERLANGLGS